MCNSKYILKNYRWTVFATCISSDNPPGTRRHFVEFGFWLYLISDCFMQCLSCCPFVCKWYVYKWTWCFFPSLVLGSNFTTSFQTCTHVLLKCLSLLQMPWLVVLWPILTLFRGLPCLNQHKSQSIQNTYARIVTNHRKYTHATPTLKQLYWLPVTYCCVFKTATLVYQFLQSGSASYFEPFLCLGSCFYSTRTVIPPISLCQP